MYDRKKVLGIHMFGIKYGQYLDEVPLKELISEAGLNDSYYTELSKGKAIYKSLLNNDFGVRFYKSGDIVSDSTKSNSTPVDSRQQIYYGAPGTGKSHQIKGMTAGHDAIRTTFHPDTDYATFVGAYKPTMDDATEENASVTSYEERMEQPQQGRDTRRGKQIVYKFVMQSFLQAYVKAWSYQQEAMPKPVYLVIEEINRGNCAQIFGDIFQLLDRNDKGFSDYPINVDADLEMHLREVMQSYYVARRDEINQDYNEDVVSAVLQGKKLVLPDNLYIIATMNTSDQSLFPIDSAFKRRWDWHYVPINDAHTGWYIKVNGKRYDWWTFLKAINGRIYDLIKSEDKQLGYFFCKATPDGVVTADTFVGKVIFYLWNDVFKDFGFEESNLFKDAAGNEIHFTNFYDTDATGKTIVREDLVEQFLKNLELKPMEDVAPQEEEAAPQEEEALEEDITQA
jgi:5-methylcytosine-specific restriction endonuclease McrBC GTP-binding regulatory subunit McrB